MRQLVELLQSSRQNCSGTNRLGEILSDLDVFFFVGVLFSFPFFSFLLKTEAIYLETAHYHADITSDLEAVDLSFHTCVRKKACIYT